MALIKIKDLQEAVKLIKEALAMLDKIYHAIIKEEE